MISQKCPKCRSTRIRRGYRPTPLWSKIIFRYHLLCDGCNWEFKGFAVPGTVSTGRKNKKKINDAPFKDAKQENSEFFSDSLSKQAKIRKRIKTKL